MTVALTASLLTCLVASAIGDPVEGVPPGPVAKVTDHTDADYQGWTGVVDLEVEVDGKRVRGQRRYLSFGTLLLPLCYPAAFFASPCLTPVACVWGVCLTGPEGIMLGCLWPFFLYDQVRSMQIGMARGARTSVRDELAAELATELNPEAEVVY